MYLIIREEHRRIKRKQMKMVREALEMIRLRKKTKLLCSMGNPSKPLRLRV